MRRTRQRSRSHRNLSLFSLFLAALPLCAQITSVPAAVSPYMLALTEVTDVPTVANNTTSHALANRGTEPPAVTLETFMDTLVNSCETSYTLTGGLPEGGTYSGEGVADGSFAPLGLLGDVVITYTYDDGNGNIGSATQTIHVIDVVSASPDSVTTCVSDVPVQINTLPSTAEWVPEQPISADGLLDVSQPYNYAVGCYYTDVLGCQAFGYTNVNVVAPALGYAYIEDFEGATVVCLDHTPVGVTTSLAGGGEISTPFDPAANGVGIYIYIGYGDTTLSGCAANDTLLLEVVAGQEVTLAAFSDTLVNSCETFYPLTGGLPVGGLYSGDGVDGDFSPLGLLGDIAITYTYADSVGCSASATGTIRVINGISVVPGSVQQCVSDVPVQLTAQPVPEVWFDAIVSPDGVLNTAQPFTGGVYCAWTDVLGCQTYGSVFVDLKAYSEGSASVAGQDPFPEQVCINADPFTIDRSLVDGTSEVITFDPLAEGLGDYQFIGYAFDDGSGCLRNDTISFSVVGAPIITLQQFPDTLLRICAESAYTLPTGSPAGGTWSGPGVAGGVFSPFSVQGDPWLSYSVDLGSGCVAADSAMMHLISGVPHFPVSDVLYRCVGSDPVQYTTQPAGAVWGAPATPDGYVDMLTPYEDFMEYIYTDAAGCLFGASIETVISLPTLGSVNIPADNHLVCIDAPPIFIYWSTADGFGGDTTFIPSLAGPGTFYFTGQGIVQAGPTQCYQDVVDSVIVIDEAVALVLDLGPLFTDGLPVVLGGGSPAAGNYSGAGVTDSIFDPAAAGYGWHVITYTVDSGICAGEAIDSVFVDFGTGMQVVTNGPALHVWPVPAQDMLQVTLPAHVGTIDLVLVDARGREVLRTTTPSSTTSPTITLATAQLANGTYTLFARGLENTAPARIIIAR